MGVDIIGKKREEKFIIDNIVEDGMKYGIKEGVRNVKKEKWMEEGEKV